ncbi:hypothetical protein BDV39DRAFT_169246 [Aspergillus sergii]|uniref:Uncharacterized protein n=1 Tax=Aspergillus sergii TaxID=1034303 RepID=A0A5N6XD98_9EURO|nr:hypothetical protein BDV39DRAFT_169246 [Aspergillus sergii]
MALANFEDCQQGEEIWYMLVGLAFRSKETNKNYTRRDILLPKARVDQGPRVDWTYETGAIFQTDILLG